MPVMIRFATVVSVALWFANVNRELDALCNRMILPLIVVTIVGFAIYAFIVWWNVRKEAVASETAVPALNTDAAAVPEPVMSLSRESAI